MNNQLLQKNSLWSRFTNFFFSDHNKSPRRKFYNTLWAILFGFIVSGLIILFSGHNPFKVFISLFTEGTTTFGNKLVSVFVAYLIASLAVAICFKSGLFNIGISGQMMMGGFTTLLIFKKMSINGSNVVLAIFIAMLIGLALALVAGMLKIFFGINEVVSTIMLNWIAFFVIKFLVQKISGLSDPDSMAANLSSGYIMPNFFQPTGIFGEWYTNNWNWILLSIALIFVLLIWMILSKTTLGYKIKMVGLNKDAADYSGTNKKALILLVMSISGALSGLAGFIWYVGHKGQINIAEQPLTAGFDAIAISLLVFNNPIGIALSSFMYGIMNVGSIGIPTEFIGLPKEINEIVVGIMVYVAAVCVVFSKLNVGQWIRKFFILSPLHNYRIARVDYWKSNIKYVTSWFNVKKNVTVIWIHNHSKWKAIKNEHKHQIIKLENELKNKYQSKSKHFNVDIMSDHDKIYYFDTLAKLKKTTDFKLAENAYFEKNGIYSRRIENHKKSQQIFQKIKTEMLIAHDQYSQTKQVIKQAKKHAYKETSKIKLEEALIISWCEINSIDLHKGIISVPKVVKLKEKIVAFGREHQMNSLISTTEQQLSKGGK